MQMWSSAKRAFLCRPTLRCTPIPPLLLAAVPFGSLVLYFFSCMQCRFLFAVEARRPSVYVFEPSSTVFMAASALPFAGVCGRRAVCDQLECMRLQLPLLSQALINYIYACTTIFFQINASSRSARASASSCCMAELEVLDPRAPSRSAVQY